MERQITTFTLSDFGRTLLSSGSRRRTWASWSERMTQISPMLAVSDASAAIEFYKRAFGATLLWHVDGGGHVVAGLAVDDARFFLASESPPHGIRGPGSVGFTTVRIELFVDDPVEVHECAVGRRGVQPQPGTRTCAHHDRTETDSADASGCDRGPVRSHVAGRENPRVA